MHPELIIPFAFPIFFAGVWLLIVTILSAASGWKALETRFPDRDEPAIRAFRMASGVMGMNVRMSNILTLSVCRGGLRVGIWKLFAPFSKPFFVPWEHLSIQRTKVFLARRARLGFGAPLVGGLEISATLADQLAAASEGRWPERPAAAAAPIVS